MIGEPVVASVEEQQSRIPVVFNAKPHPTLHSFRYTFEPEGVDKSCGVLVPPEPGTSDGMVVFGGLNKNGQEYHFKSTEIPAKECDYVLSLTGNSCVINKLESTHILRYTRKSRRNSEQHLHQNLISSSLSKATEHDDEVNKLDEELFNDLL